MWIPMGRPDAMARVAGNKAAPCLYGTVKFYQMAKNVLVVAEMFGLPESDTDIFAMHIHEGGCCSGEDFSKTGSHFNPTQQKHPKHAGDLPPLLSCKGSAFMTVLTDRFCVQQILGKTLVIHSDADDFRTQPAGNAGQKIACGVIGAF